jgi:large subunit ribosomal protein L4
MPTVAIKNLKNESVGEIELRDEVFGVPLNESLIYYAVNNYLTNQRQGTVRTKTRGNVSGSGKKLWKQKGTGRARIASLRSPLWKGGGNVHGPQPRDWTSKMPTKMKRGALKSALSERLREGNLFIIDALNLDDHKTKSYVAVAKAFGWDSKTLIVETEPGNNLAIASRNVPGVKVAANVNVNIYDVLYHDKIVFTRDAINALQEKLGGNAKARQTEEVEENEPVEQSRAATTDEVAMGDVTPGGTPISEPEPEETATAASADEEQQS